jgi:large subunit ribosomal protein L15
MPLQRRLPKRGFTSFDGDDVAEVRLDAVARLEVVAIDLESLKAAGLVPRSSRAAKIILAGSISRPITVSGVKLTKGARGAVESAGGSVSDAQEG